MSCQASARAPLKASLQRAALTLALAAAALPGCNTQVGHEPNPAPQVVITPIGYKVASGSTSPTITVRSGADVVLSGKDSSGYGIALKSFQWSQSGGPALPALPDAGALLYRTSDTVSFRAPQVSSPTPLTFQLTVTNANDASSSGTITVTVEPASDSDRFLITPGAVHRFGVAVVTTDGLGTTSTQPLPANVVVCVQVARQVYYRNRSTNYVTEPLEQLSTLQADASWAAGTVVAGTGTPLSTAAVQTAVSDYSNPRVTFEVPEFNDDELFAKFNQPSNVQLPMQLVPADIDAAQLQLTVSATPGSCDHTVSGSGLSSSQLIVALVDSTGTLQGNPSPAGAPGQPTSLKNDPSGALLTPDWLLANIDAGQPLENAALAMAYYKAIDPNAYMPNNDPKATLQGWLQCNGFDPNASDYGVGAAGANGAHAVYVNNYDLGFGRDMYFMRIATPPATPPGCPASQAGDMASVVINYASLEQAALKQTPINAVAMEYAAASSNPGHRFPKFYIYSLDDRTGQFVRVLSANFDRRGQKYVPNACVPCHGGTPPGLPRNFTAGGAYPAIPDPTNPTSSLAPGDLDAAFLPWDLDSFLYSDTDPAFSGQIVPGANYVRAAQEPALKALNVLAYATYKPETETVQSASGPVQVDRFAAARSLIEQWYGGADFPATYNDTNTAASVGWGSQAKLYHAAYARNCRTCHTLNSTPAHQFADPTNGYESFAQEFMQASPSAVPGLGKLYVFKQGVMPLARLTADRFWVDYGGGSSSADALATALQQYPNQTDLLASTGTAEPTGQPQPNVAVMPNPVARLQGARIDASTSTFISSYDWSLYLCSSSTPMPAQSPGSCATLPLVGSTTTQPSFYVAKPGYYELSLTANNGFGQTLSPAAFEYYMQPNLPVALPGSPGCLNPDAAPLNVTTTMAVQPCLSNLGLPAYSLAIASSSGGPYGPNTGAGNWNATVLPPTPPATAPEVNFTFTSNSLASAILYYQWCSLDGCAMGSATANLATVLAPLNATLNTYWTDNTVNGVAGPGSWIPLSTTTTPPSASLATLEGALITSLAGVPATQSGTLVFGTPSSGSLSPMNFSGTAASLPGQLLTATFSAPTPPPPLLTCDINGMDVSNQSMPCSPVTTSTTLTFGTQTQAGTVSIRVNALTTFSRANPSVFGVLGQPGTGGQSCSTSGCHTGTGGGTGFWTYVLGDPGTTYSNLKPFVAPGSPSTSAFYTAPCVPGMQPPGMPQVFAQTDLNCRLIYQWILEGGYND
jgi:hypothetical protein